MLVGSTAVSAWLAVAGRALRAAAVQVADALDDGDLARARVLLPTLVGRDVATLDAKGIARAVVESVAENTVDAVVAPALWAATAGAPGALGYRAVNTLDSMVGHRSDRYEHYGWASARLDDAAAWLPSRGPRPGWWSCCRPGRRGGRRRGARPGARTPVPQRRGGRGGLRRRPRRAAPADRSAAKGAWSCGPLSATGRAVEPGDILLAGRPAVAPVGSARAAVLADGGPLRRWRR